MTVGFTEGLHSTVLMHPVSSRHDFMFYKSIFETLQLRLTYIPVVGAKEPSESKKHVWRQMFICFSYLSKEEKSSTIYTYLLVVVCYSVLPLCLKRSTEEVNTESFSYTSPWQVYEVWRWSKVSLWGIRAAWARTGEAAPFIEGCCASLLWYATLARGKQIKK